MGARAAVVLWLLDASVPAVRAMVVVGVVGVGGAVLLAVATVVHARRRAGPTLQRARPTLQVRIPGTRGQMGRASGKVVGGREVGCNRAGHVPSAGNTGVGAVRRTKRGAGTLGSDRVFACDGHRGGSTLVHGETAAGHGGLPVDGLEAVFELTGGAKLPLADDGPDGDGSDETRGGDDEGDEDGLRKEGGSLILGLVCLLGSGSRAGGCSNEDDGATGAWCGAGEVCSELKGGCGVGWSIGGDRGLLGGRGGCGYVGGGG